MDARGQDFHVGIMDREVIDQLSTSDAGGLVGKMSDKVCLSPWIIMLPAKLEILT